ncbi:peroxiredoxin [Bdellovibrio svalbardensis]|uniref:thioredoxin-dependent peroxiredoxin n=1 Tax=Bdellovibrio svalbardensis TaxID=2972972 RepID=A0ABT6DMC1_9BACT|nr:peroxiredoxin [Bdellovibrio svalbardensis]MDG0818022.1 peroxiredoxin [Bdellovibrio svalbardensis]
MTFQFILSLALLFSPLVRAADLKIGDSAPVFSAKTQEGKDFNLADRKGQWTVLYFYPKAGTPGCTKQACAFRDNIEKIRSQGADVFGISADSVEAQAAFHKEHRLTFTLLADPEDKVVNLYGSKMPFLKMSKRWTFLIDPSLKIRSIAKDVDPVMDSERVAKEISEFQTQDKAKK